jgi:hypothetical protein
LLWHLARQRNRFQFVKDSFAGRLGAARLCDPGSPRALRG